MPDDTIYLKRGQNLNFTTAFKNDDGTPIVINESWTATAAMKRKDTCDTINLSPTISDGNVIINQATDDLSAGVYEIDVLATDGTLEASDVFYLNLSKTITPI